MPTLSPQTCLLLADAILVLHFAFVIFVVLGFVVIWVGHFRRKAFVRNFYFRLVHLLMMGIVAAQAVCGVACPLTVWEYNLRVLGGAEGRYDSSFIEYWLHRAMFFELPPAFFLALYVTFFLLIVLTFWKIPPRLPRRWKSASIKPTPQA